MRKLLIALSLLSSLVAGPAGAQAQPKLLGVYSPDVDLAAQIGFTTIQKDVWVNSTYRQLSSLPQTDQASLASLLQSARKDGVKVVINLWQINWVKKTDPPNRPNQWHGMCNVAENIIDQDIGNAIKEGTQPAIVGLVVGVEPNSKNFWESQSNSAETYEKWLAACYDQIKPFHVNLPIYGGSLASSAGPGGTGPGAFIKRMCQAEQQSGRETALMDGFDMHSYENESPDTQHPNTDVITVADYAKLEALLSCFGQGPMPILWGEVGYQTKIPGGQGSYNHAETAPVLDETTQGQDYARVFQMVYCDQPEAVGAFIFHLVDDPDLRQWQSGLIYAGSVHWLDAKATYVAKQSLDTVQQFLAEVASGQVQCS